MTIAEKLTGGTLKPQFLSEEKMNEIKKENSKKWDKTRSNWDEIKKVWNKIENPFWSDEDEKKYQEEKNKKKEEVPGQKGVYIDKQINTKIEITVPPFIRDLNPLIDTGRIIG